MNPAETAFGTPFVPITDEEAGVVDVAAEVDAPAFDSDTSCARAEPDALAGILTNDSSPPFSFILSFGWE